MPRPVKVAGGDNTWQENLPAFGNVASPMDFHRQYLTLSELNGLIRCVVEDNFPEAFWVVAELSQVSRNRHCYLDLVEKQAGGIVAKARATLWASRCEVVDTFESVTGETLKAGMQVLLQVQVAFHEVYGLSLNVLDLNPEFTLGALARKRRETLERLHAEGLLALNKAFDLPLAPLRIAVVSSAGAAGYQDFCHQLASNPRGYAFHHTLYPALVQGEGAEASLVEALRRVRTAGDRFDAVVVLRGGGAAVDLACFDGYEVAAAIARCPLPVITGIGHERDETVADVVAHTRAKTPTAVADLLVARVCEFEDGVLSRWALVSAAADRRLADAERDLAGRAYRLAASVERATSARREALQASALRCMGAAGARLNERAEALIEARTRAGLYARQALERAEGRLDAAERDIRHLDPAHVLRRGYSITRVGGRAVRSVAGLAPGTELQTQVLSGAIISRVERTEDTGGHRDQG